MRIKYSQHIENRLQLRKIEHDLPKRIFELSQERYLDAETGYSIAIMKTELYGKIKEVMVAYVLEEDYAKLLTIHPLKERQKENRVASGRWKKI